MSETLAEAAYCTVCGSRSLRRATWGKRCDLLQPDLSRCAGILTPAPAPDDAEGKG